MSRLSHRSPVWLPILVLCGSADATAQPAPPANLQGLWRVADSACAGCDPAQGPETGAQLRISAQGYQNPFAEDCAQAVVAEALAPESEAALQQRLGLPARWLAADPAQAAVQSFRIWCGAQASFQVIRLSGGDLLVPTEASTVLRLVPAASR